MYITPHWGGFASSIARQPRGCQYRTIRLRKALGQMFPTPTFLAPTLFQLWRYRAWKIGPGVCDIYIYRIRGTCCCHFGRFCINFGRFGKFWLDNKNSTSLNPRPFSAESAVVTFSFARFPAETCCHRCCMYFFVALIVGRGLAGDRLGLNFVRECSFSAANFLLPCIVRRSGSARVASTGARAAHVLFRTLMPSVCIYGRATFYSRPGNLVER